MWFQGEIINVMQLKESGKQLKRNKGEITKKQQNLRDNSWEYLKEKKKMENVDG
jgi:hypothetical protein